MRAPSGLPPQGRSWGEDGGWSVQATCPSGAIQIGAGIELGERVRPTPASHMLRAFAVPELYHKKGCC